MHYLKTLVGACLAAMSAGCATVGDAAKPVPATPIETHISDSAKRVESLMIELNSARAANAASAAGIRSSGMSLDSLVSVKRFDGDAEGFVRQLAATTGHKFVALGRVKLPLPITVEVKDVPLIEVLKIVGYQLGGRADLALTNEGFELRYAAK